MPSIGFKVLSNSQTHHLWLQRHWCFVGLYHPWAASTTEHSSLHSPYSISLVTVHLLRLPHRLLTPLCSFSLISNTDYSVPQPPLKCCVLQGSTLDNLLTKKSYSPLPCGNTQVSIFISGDPAEYLDPVLLNTSTSVLYSYLRLTHSRWNSLSSSSFCSQTCSFFYFFFFLFAMPCSIQKFLDQGLNLCFLHWKHGFLSTGLPGKASIILFKLNSDTTHTSTQVRGD